MTDLVRRDVLHHGEKLMGDEHRRAGLVAVDEEHQSPRVAVDLRESGLVAVRQTGRGLRIYDVDAAQELPLFLGQLYPLAVVRFDRLFRYGDVDALAGRIALCEGDMRERDQSADNCDMLLVQHRDLLWARRSPLDGDRCACIAGTLIESSYSSFEPALNL